VLLAAVYSSQIRAWSDIDIIKLLSFRRKSILAGDLNAKHPFCTSKISVPSVMKLLNLLNINEFEISAPQLPIH
jgi:hypothetical protein